MSEKMKNLAAHKRLIIAQADLHRQVIEQERQRLRQRVGQTRDFVRKNRWWLVGGAIASGFVLAPKKRGWLGWLPLASKLLRIFETTD
jgi:ElaB/YqjD/DUF883 family membrane-anchored ribosome-binding protein